MERSFGLFDKEPDFSLSNLKIFLSKNNFLLTIGIVFVEILFTLIFITRSLFKQVLIFFRFHDE